MCLLTSLSNAQGDPEHMTATIAALHLVFCTPPPPPCPTTALVVRPPPGRWCQVPARTPGRWCQVPPILSHGPPVVGARCPHIREKFTTETHFWHSQMMPLMPIITWKVSQEGPQWPSMLVGANQKCFSGNHRKSCYRLAT